MFEPGFNVMNTVNTDMFIIKVNFKKGLMLGFI